MNITRNQALTAGGRLWTSPNGNITRVYFQPETLLDLEVTRYKSGNICGATLAGERISNAEADRILASRIYADKDGVHVQTSSRTVDETLVCAAIERRLAETEAQEAQA